jgi:hypothetical protein
VSVNTTDLPSGETTGDETRFIIHKASWVTGCLGCAKPNESTVRVSISGFITLGSIASEALLWRAAACG